MRSGHGGQRSWGATRLPERDRTDGFRPRAGGGERNAPCGQTPPTPPLPGPTGHRAPTSLWTGTTGRASSSVHLSPTCTSAGPCPTVVSVVGGNSSECQPTLGRRTCWGTQKSRHAQRHTKRSEMSVPPPRCSQDHPGEAGGRAPGHTPPALPSGGQVPRLATQRTWGSAHDRVRWPDRNLHRQLRRAVASAAEWRAGKLSQREQATVCDRTISASTGLRGDHSGTWARLSYTCGSTGRDRRESVAGAPGPGQWQCHACHEGDEPETLGAVGRGVPRLPSAMTPLIRHVSGQPRLGKHLRGPCSGGAVRPQATAERGEVADAPTSWNALRSLSCPSTQDPGSGCNVPKVRRGP